MEPAQPGHFWKIPFYWQPGCAVPPPEGRLEYKDVDRASLEALVGEIMSTGPDESDQAAVSALGARAAARELLDVDPEYFQTEPTWWRMASDADGKTVGIVLPVLLRQERHWRDGKPQGTIYYMGVLPQHRGKGYGRELLDEATRLFLKRDCWRVFCDASATNEPMLRAFRSAGYTERSPWQRPLR